MRAIGQGYSGLTFTSLLNLPKPVTANNYDKIINRLVRLPKQEQTLQCNASDSKSFSTIKNTYPGITVEKLECVGHV